MRAFDLSLPTGISAIFIMAVILFCMHVQAAKIGQAAPLSFSITISAKTSLKAGSPLQVAVVIRNISGHDMLLQTEYIRPFVEVTDRVSVTETSGATINETKFGKKVMGHDGAGAFTGKVVRTPLLPDQSFKYQLDISELYDLNRPGRYNIRIERFDDISRTFVKSNAVTVIVTP